jgi:hypothetical protein
VVTTTTAPTLRIGGKDYPVVLPTRRDPRLHLAAVIISIHVLGISTLGFDVSIPQILTAILVCAAIEVVVTLMRTGTLVWPASAMLTGSGIALILRVVGTPPGDLWSWHGWYFFAAVGAGALFTKYVIRYRGTHVFNPSNVALVAAFLLFGSSVIEPLDFWWAPLNAWMVAAYAIILVGGLVITSRLGLLPMAAAFWATLAVALGILAASGHCFTARWALDPVCDARFWWIVVTSPELLIFLFFMITDPKTIPAGGAARAVFAVSLGLLTAVLIAPQTTEFGAKVALLGGLVLLTPTRWVFDRAIPRRADHSRLAELAAAVAASNGTGFARLPTMLRGGVVGVAAVVIGVVVVAAGTHAREPTPAAVVTPLPADVAVDVAALPAVTLDDEIQSLNTDIDFAAEAQEMAVNLAENIATEARAIETGNAQLLSASSFGQRLINMRKRVEEAADTGEGVVISYRFDTLTLTRVVLPGGQGSDMAFDATGEAEFVVHHADGSAQTASAPFSATFALRQAGGERWLLTEVLDEPEAP